MSTPADDTFKAAIAALKNDRHRKFVAAFIQMIADGKPNAAEAYRQAGYTTKSPQVAAAAAERLLRAVEIKAIVDAARKLAQEASAAAVIAATGDLTWKRAKLVYIAEAGTAKLKLKKGELEVEGEHADLGAAVRAIQTLAKIDGDEKPQEHIHRAHESLLDMLR